MKENKFLRQLAVVLMIAIGCAATFSNAFLNDWLVDECYQALSVRDYANAPLAMLSYAIGHVWTWAFGESLAGLRILRSICYILAAGSACLWMWRRTQRALLASFLFMLVMLPAVFSEVDIYNWDTGSYPFLAFSIIAGLWYMEQPSVRRAALWGAATVFAVMSRLPLGVLLPIAFTVILIKRTSARNRLIDSAAGLCSFIVAALVLMTAMVGSPIAFTDALNTDNIISGHTEMSMLIYRFVLTTKFVVAAWLPGGIAVVAGLQMVRFRKWQGVIAVVAICGILWSVALLDSYNQLGTELIAFGFLQPVGLMALTMVLVQRHQKERKAEALFVTVCAMAAMVGSDGFFSRPTIFIALPLLFPLLTARQLDVSKPALGLYLVGALVFFVQDISYYGRNCSVTVEEYPQLRHFRITPACAERIRTVASLADSLSACGDSWVLTGMGKFEMVYLLQSDAGLDHHLYHSNIDGLNAAHADRIAAAGYDAVIVVNHLPVTDHHLPVVPMLEQRGYEIEAVTPQYLLMKKASGR